MFSVISFATRFAAVLSGLFIINWLCTWPSVNSVVCRFDTLKNQ